MNYHERRARGIKNLPSSLSEALKYFQTSDLMKKTLGDHIHHHFLEAKKIEWAVYKRQVHNWEIDQYIATY
jgi:glutamine synthetase